MLAAYKTESYYDEMFMGEGKVRDIYHPFSSQIQDMSESDLARRQYFAEKALVSLGITFKVYGDPEKEERIIPFDIIPRIVGSKEWDKLEKGLKQRTEAMNLFINDIYNEKRILKDGIIPTEYILSSGGYLKEAEGLNPPRGIWTHISGTDLIRDASGSFYVLEDNLRCPSGVSYVLKNRDVMKRIFPQLFEELSIRPIYDYTLRLRSTLEYLSDRDEPQVAVLTPGIYNSAYYEHSLLAQEMGVPLVEGRDLTEKDGYIYMKTTNGPKRIDVIYRRVDDIFLDPDVFNPDSLLGVKGLFNAYKKGNIVLANAPGNGVADDKMVYAFAPDIIKYYLNEEMIIPNVPTYLCYKDKDRKYILENLEKLVVKEVNSSGGYGMLIGPAATKEQLSTFKKLIEENPRNYIAQPTISLSRIPTVVNDSIEGRHVDLRPYILYGKDVYVMPGGLTRVALKKGSLVVNSSQGGGTKDTWVMGY